MARIRTIKPEFFTSLDMADHDLFTRLVFIGLWTHCDDYGRCIYDPRLIRAALFPLDDSVSPEDLRKALEALHAAGQVLIYDHGSRAYLQVAKWDDHQRVSHPGKDKLPAYDDDGSTLRKVSGDTRETLVPEQGTGKGKEVHPPKRKDDPDTFPEFWDAYPRKEAKQKARTAWRNLSKTDQAAALEALPRHVALWATKDRQFTPLPPSWLNGRRWEDEITSVDQPSTKRIDGGLNVAANL